VNLTPHCVEVDGRGNVHVVRAFTPALPALLGEALWQAARYASVGAEAARRAVRRGERAR